MRPPHFQETIPLLKDESIPVNEKIDYLESWVIRAESEKLQIEQQFRNTEFYPREHGEAELRRLKRQIENKQNEIKQYEVRLKFYRKIQEEQTGSEENLIKEFAKDFVASPNAKRPAEEIEAYLNSWIHHAGYGRRARAKREAGLKDLSDGTVENWEIHWTVFLSSRATK